MMTHGVRQGAPDDARRSGKDELRELCDRALFRAWHTDVLRLADIDHQGHVNNAVHMDLFTSGRYNFFEGQLRAHLAPGTRFAVARITIEYLSEMRLPGTVECGTLIRRIGRTSLTFGQALFKDGACAAVSETVMVTLDPRTRRPQPLSPAAIAQLEKFKPAA
jgi:acyl-CoA thioester hydrolase